MDENDVQIVRRLLGDLQPHALDHEAVVAAEVKLPRQDAHRFEELVEVLGVEAPGLYEDALGRAQAEVGAHERGARLLAFSEAESNAAGFPSLDREADALDLVLTYLFETERANGEAIFG